MAEYIVPRVQIEQEFTQLPVFSEQPLAALVIGPQYKLSRYTNVAEKANTIVTHPDDDTLANAYQADVDVVYSYTNKSVGSIVDASYTKVYLEKAEAQYFPNSSLGSASAAVTRVSIPTGGYYKNRVKAAINLKTANGTDRNAVFSNRDVKVGDVVVLSNGSSTSKSKVKSLIADVVAASYGSVTNDVSNKPSLVMDVNDSPIFTGTGSLTNIVLNNTSSAWYGRPDLGIVSDVVTIEVTTGGAVLSDLRFKISSQNGSFTTLTNQSLTNLDLLIINNTGSNDVKIDFTNSTGTFLTTHKWTLAIRAVVSQVTPTASGTYTGTKDVTYKLTVTRGSVVYRL